MQLDPARAVFRYEWARSLAARGDTVGASDQLRKSVELQPSLVEAHHDLSRLALQSKDWTAAATSLRALLAWRSGDASAHRDLAMALEGLGDRDGAASERATARRLDSERKANR